MTSRVPFLFSSCLVMDPRSFLATSSRTFKAEDSRIFHSAHPTNNTRAPTVFRTPARPGRAWDLPSSAPVHGGKDQGGRLRRDHRPHSGGPACSLCLCAQLPSCPRSQTLTQPVSQRQRAPHLSPRLPIFFLQSVPRARSTFQKLLGVVTSQGRSFGVHRLLLGPAVPPGATLRSGLRGPLAAPSRVC